MSPWAKNGLLAPNDPRHGTHNGYNNHGCRCAACTKANTAFHREARWRRGTVPMEEWKRLVKERALATAPHGRSRYSRHGCRCDVCREAVNEYQRNRRALMRAGLWGATRELEASR